MNKEEKKMLSDEDLSNVSGGDISDFEIILIGLLVVECQKAGMTKEEFMNEFKTRYQNKTHDYYELLGYAYSIWDDAEAYSKNNA